MIRSLKVLYVLLYSSFFTVNHREFKAREVEDYVVLKEIENKSSSVINGSLGYLMDN